MAGKPNLSPAELARDCRSIEEEITHLRALHSIREVADTPGSPLAPPVVCPPGYRLPAALPSPVRRFA